MDEKNYIKIKYMNDEQKQVTVQVIHEFKFDVDHPTTLPKIEYWTLEAAEARIFTIEAPHGAIPYVKKWDKMVLLSYC